MFETILVPLDGSPLAEKILVHVKGLAKAHGAEVLLLRVAFAPPLPGADPMDTQVKVVDDAKAYVLGLEDRLRGEGFKVLSAIRYGNAAREILEHAAEHQVSLIAMSTHGRSGLRRLLMGSIAESVLREATVPILLVRALE